MGELVERDFALVSNEIIGDLETYLRAFSTGNFEKTSLLRVA